MVKSKPTRYEFSGQPGLSFLYVEPTAIALARYRDEAFGIGQGPNGAKDLVQRKGVNEAWLRLAFECLKSWEGYLDDSGTPVPLTWEEFLQFPGRLLNEFTVHLSGVISPGPDEGKGSASRSEAA